MIRNKLSAKFVETVKKPGRYSDGAGLYLLVRGRGRKWWVFRYQRRGVQHDLGLGSAGGGEDSVTLEDARLKVDAQRRILKNGHDPLQHRRAEAATKLAEEQARVTFGEAVDAYIETHRAGWRSEKHADQWRSSLDTYAGPVLGKLHLDQIEIAHVLKVLKPIWTEKVETAKRLRARIEKVIGYGIAHGWSKRDNPARWGGLLSELLPSPKRLAKVQHHPALPWQEIGTFVAALRARPAIAARALEFTIATAARTSEVIGARWSEFDLERGVWAVPPERMKANREHRVPLAEPLVEMLRALREAKTKPEHFVFHRGSPMQPLSNMAMLALLQRMGRDDLTTHGFRSTFRDWAREATNFPREVAELALAHVNKDRVEAAYARGDLFAKRAKLMAAWAAFMGKVPKEAGATVTTIGGARVS